MEQWRKIISSKNAVDDVGILDKAVTGIKGTSDVPDGVFYSEFTEKEAESYRAIFIKFAELYSISPRIAISALEEDIEEQNSAVIDHFCPVELILYSTRYIGGIIASDPKVFRKLKAIVSKLLSNDSHKIAQYILGGWEWKTQLAIFVEAIGNSVPDLVDDAMKYYPKIAELCADDDKLLLKSYINMLLDTQDESFAEYFSDVVTNREFMNNNETIDYFCTAIKSNTFWKREAIAQQIFEELDGRNLTVVFRKRIEDMKRQLLHVRTNAESSISEMLNSKNIDFETKIEWAKKLKFTYPCDRDLLQWELVRNPDGCVLADKQGMDNIDEIMPDELRGRAYVVLGTHGKHHKEEVIEFLHAQKMGYPEYSFPIDIALYDLRVITADSLFNSFFTLPYKGFYAKNLGKYFRYNKMAFANEFIPYFARIMKSSSVKETEISDYIGIVLDVLKAYNAKDGRLADETFAIPEKVLEILAHMNLDFKLPLTYERLLDAFDLIASVSLSSRKDILNRLDQIKMNVSRIGHMPSVEYHVITLIKQLDGLAGPSGQ